MGASVQNGKVETWKREEENEFDPYAMVGN